MKTLKDLLAIQIDRVMKAGSVVNTALLSLNLSLIITPFISWRGGPAWMWVLGTLIVVSSGIFIFSHIWTQKMDMVRALRKASAMHDAPQVYQIVPLERVIWIHVIIPQMEAQAAVCRAVGAVTEAEKMEQKVKQAKRWESLGFIPREEYPEHLLHYYWQTEGAL